MTDQLTEATHCAHRCIQGIMSELSELLSDLEYADDLDVAKSAHRRISVMSNDLGLLSVNLGERIVLVRAAEGGR